MFEVELTEVLVNQPIEQDLTLEFPEGAIVIDHRSQRLHIWGKGAPERTFASRDEFDAWNNERQRQLLEIDEAERLSNHPGRALGAVRNRALRAHLLPPKAAPAIV